MSPTRRELAARLGDLRTRAAGHGGDDEARLAAARDEVRAKLALMRANLMSQPELLGDPAAHDANHARLAAVRDEVRAELAAAVQAPSVDDNRLLEIARQLRRADLHARAGAGVGAVVNRLQVTAEAESLLADNMGG